MTNNTENLELTTEYQEVQKKPSAKLRKEQKELIRRMAAMEETDEKITLDYRKLLDRIAIIDDILEKRKAGRWNGVKIGGGLLLGAASLFLAYRNDTSDYPVHHKETGNVLQRLLGSLIKF